MELMGVIAAFETLKKLPGAPGGEVTVYTDSQYVQKGMTEWIRNWKARGWRTSDKESVKNQDLWQRLDGLAADRPGKWAITSAAISLPKRP